MLFAGCEKDQQEPPKATVVPEEEAAPEAIEPVMPEPVQAPPAVEDDRTIGERVDGAVGAAGHGLQVAGEKTREGVGIAAEKTEEALHTAGEKTEEGVKKAADATGRFLQRVGEKLEDAAETKPAEP